VETARLVWPLCFAAGLLLTFPAMLTGGRLFYLRDFHPFFYPQKLFLARGLAEGFLPLWQPHAGCGVPFFASLQPGVFYPPSLLLLVGPFFVGLKLFIGFHLLLAFISAALLARRLLGTGAWPSALAAAAYTFGGFTVSVVSPLNNLQSAAWAPLVLLAVIHFARSPGLLRLGGASAAAGVQLLGGGVEVTLLTWVAALVLAAFPPDLPEGGRPRWWWRGPLLVLPAIVLGVALVAFQALPTAEMAHRSTRGVEGFGERPDTDFSLRPGNLPNLAVPRQLTDAGSPDYMRAFPPGPVPWMISIYQGVVVTYLAALGLLGGRRRRGLRLALFGCAVVGLILALGNSFAVTSVLLHALPGSGWFRYPEKLIFLLGLTVPLLAALGCDRGSGRESRVPKPVIEVMAVLLPLSAIVVAAAGGATLGRYAIGQALVLLLLAVVVRLAWHRGWVSGQTVAVLLSLLVLADLGTAHRPVNGTVPVDFYEVVPAAAQVILEDHAAGAEQPAVPPRCRSTLPGLPGGPPVIERGAASPLETHFVWRAYLTPNSTGIHGISQVRGSSGMELPGPGRREHLLAAAGLEDKLALLCLWGVTHLVMDRELPAREDLAPLVFETEVPGQRLYRLPWAFPRIFIVDGDLAGSYGEAEARLLAGEGGMASFVEALRADAAMAEFDGESLSVIDWRPGAVTVAAEVVREGRVLALTEGFDPGWSARLDGRRLVPLEGLGGFCLVAFPGPGSHLVTLEYRPPLFTAGLLVSGVFLLALVAAGLLPRALRRRCGRGPGLTAAGPRH